jgi:hypothetical protein
LRLALTLSSTNFSRQVEKHKYRHRVNDEVRRRCAEKSEEDPEWCQQQKNASDNKRDLSPTFHTFLIYPDHLINEKANDSNVKDHQQKPEHDHNGKFILKLTSFPGMNSCS